MKKEKEINILQSYAEQIFSQGKDRYGKKQTPLLVDGLDLEEQVPLMSKDENSEYVISNLAYHQNFHRFLAGLSAVTGKEEYVQRAKQEVDFHFSKLQHENGLLHWGGHHYIDLKTKQPAARDIHELKNVFPFYDLMWEVDSSATDKYINAFWNAHVLDWSKLDINRHGFYDKEIGAVWENDFQDPEPFFAARGLSFINCGTDLIYAGGFLYNQTGQQEVLDWTKRLIKQYVKARHPETGLGVYMYSQPKKRKEEPDDINHPQFTFSTYGDRAQRQFGPEFGDIALEGNLLTPSRGRSIYGKNAFIQLELAQKLGKEGSEILQDTVRGMEAYYNYAYDRKTNMLTPMWVDGTDLTNYEIKRYGYFGKKGDRFRAQPAGPLLLYSYLKGFLMTENKCFWEMVRGIFAGQGLGDPGTKPGARVNLKQNTSCQDPLVLLSLLALYRETFAGSYLEMAEEIGDNIYENNYYQGFFLTSKEDKKVRIDTIAPLALLKLVVVEEDSYDQVPEYNTGGGY
ncbi:MAG: pectate lyase [Bacillota bacterium]